MNARTEWLAQRRTGIGGSDAGAMSDCESWQTLERLAVERANLAARYEPMREAA